MEVMGLNPGWVKFGVRDYIMTYGTVKSVNLRDFFNVIFDL